MELLGTLVNLYKSLTIAVKGYNFNSEKVHRFSSKYVTVQLFVHSCLSEGKKMGIYIL